MQICALGVILPLGRGRVKVSTEAQLISSHFLAQYRSLI